MGRTGSTTAHTDTQSTRQATVTRLTCYIHCDTISFHRFHFTHSLLSATHHAREAVTKYYLSNMICASWRLSLLLNYHRLRRTSIHILPVRVIALNWGGRNLRLATHWASCVSLRPAAHLADFDFITFRQHSSATHSPASYNLFLECLHSFTCID